MKVSNILARKNRILLRELVITDFKLRYQGSILGYAWSLLKPLFLFAIMYVVFGMMMRFGTIEHYPVYLLLGIVLWTFFSEATTQGLGSIVARGDILRKVNFPKYIIVISTTVSALVNLLLNMVIVIILMVASGVAVSPSAGMFLLCVAEIYIFGLGLALWLSAVNVKYKDIGHIWEIIMQAAFYATPIIYPLSIVVEQSRLAAKLLMLNPIAQAIQIARYDMVTKETITITGLYGSWLYNLIPIAITLLVLVIGAFYFKKHSKHFAEDI